MRVSKERFSGRAGAGRKQVDLLARLAITRGADSRIKHNQKIHLQEAGVQNLGIDSKTLRMGRELEKPTKARV